MSENINIARLFKQEGYVIIPQLFAREQVSELRLICDRILSQWFERFPRYKQRPRKKNCSQLTDLYYYFKGDREQLIFLLNTIANPRVLSILKYICDRQLLFHDLQYFFNPLHTSWRGYWHRDLQVIAPDDATEKRRLFNINDRFIRVNIALIPDDNLEIVPGSHTRWDTKEELEIRKELNGKNNTSEMPGSTKIVLNTGDAVFFDGFSIHRGNYFVDKPRRTMAMLYSSPVDYHTPPQTCFLEPNILDYLLPEAKIFFQDFVNIYKTRWLTTT